MEKESKPILFFDFEVFPSWTLMCYKYLGKEETIAISSDDPDFGQEVSHVLTNAIIMGYNIKTYDLRIARAVIAGWTPNEVYKLSKAIINDTKYPMNDYRYWSMFVFQDLIDDLHAGSLKAIESNIGMSIEETEVDFDKPTLTAEDKEMTIFYCKHDVAATEKLYEYRKNYIAAKLHCRNIFPIDIADCYRSTTAKLCAKICGCVKARPSSTIYYQIPSRLKALFEETLPADFLEYLLKTPMDNFKTTRNFFDNTVEYGLGGIHSTLTDTLICEAKPGRYLANADFTNLYPGIVTEHDYYPGSMPTAGKALYKSLLQSCRSIPAQVKQLKAEGKIAEAEALKQERESAKLILNVLTGAMRSKFSTLYDPPRIQALCITGQLITTCMCFKLHQLGAKIIQSNTDGIVFEGQEDLKDRYKELLDGLVEVTGIPLKIEECKAIYQRDVNNYIQVGMDGHIKVKGRWVSAFDSDNPIKNLNAPIVQNAVVAYYVDKKPLNETIAAGEPLDYCITTIKGRGFEFVTYEDPDLGEVMTNNVNRVYASLNTAAGKLFKNDEKRRNAIPDLPDHCALCNGTVPKQLPGLDYSWYLQKAYNQLLQSPVIL